MLEDQKVNLRASAVGSDMGSLIERGSAMVVSFACPPPQTPATSSGRQFFRHGCVECCMRVRLIRCMRELLIHGTYCLEELHLLTACVLACVQQRPGCFIRRMHAQADARRLT